MKGYALVFSGQGSERVGLLSDFINESEFENISTKLHSLLGIDIKNIAASRNQADIAGNNQMLLSVFHYLMAQQLIEQIGYMPKLCLGHSFGQFSAILNSGAVSFYDMVGLVYERMRIINNPNIEVCASLKSINGMKIDEFEDFLENENLGDDVELALHNQSEQIVCAVTEEGEKRLEALAGKYKYLVKEIHVSRPYHTSFMKEFNELFVPHVEQLKITTPICKVLLNNSKQTTNDESIFRDETKIQMVRPVHWYDSIKIAEESVDVFVIVDPGETQLKVIKRITEKRLYNVSGIAMAKMIGKKGLI